MCFFFQAEDGIRDKLVTGVQTCALPISMAAAMAHLRAGAPVRSRSTSSAIALVSRLICFNSSRSEERRVGKECRSLWSAYHLNIQPAKALPAMAAMRATTRAMLENFIALVFGCVFFFKQKTAYEIS